MAFIYGTDADDTLIGTNEGDTIFGRNGNDSLFGNEADDTLFGGDGNDNLDGGSGKDTLYGDAGNDILYGNDDDDTLYGRSGDDRLVGGLGNDQLNGDNGNDTLFGSDGNDNLFGGSGNDELHGDAGNDILNGGGGIDTLIGGAGANTFDLTRSAIINKTSVDTSNNSTVVSSTATEGQAINYTQAGNADYALIPDFDAKEDVIQLSRNNASYGGAISQSLGGNLTEILNQIQSGTFTPTPASETVELSLGTSPSGLPGGTALFANNVGTQPELIAILPNVTPGSLSLDQPYFKFV